MNTHKLLLLVTLVSAILFSSCIKNSFLQSPVLGNTFAYHAVPVASDSVKSATYFSSALSIGGENDHWQDGVYALQLGVHRSHVVDMVRFNYGASLVLGSYNLNSDSYNYSYYGGAFPAYHTGSNFFGGYNLFGGVSAATPMGRRGEWRFIGVEGGLFNEFGDYYNVRKNLPDTAATEIDRKKYIGSVGLNTELIFKGRSKAKFGIKIGAGSYLRRLNFYDAYPGNYYHPHDDLIYFSNTYHFTFNKSTTYFQFNLATHAAHFQVGYKYRF